MYRAWYFYTALANKSKLFLTNMYTKSHEISSVQTRFNAVLTFCTLPKHRTGLVVRFCTTSEPWTELSGSESSGSNFGSEPDCGIPKLDRPHWQDWAPWIPNWVKLTCFFTHLLGECNLVFWWLSPSFWGSSSTFWLKQLAGEFTWNISEFTCPLTGEVHLSTGLWVVFGWF